MKLRFLRCVVSLLVLMSFSELIAEPGIKNTNQYRRNYYMDMYANTWRANISLGGQIFYGEDDFFKSSFKRLCPALSLSIQREISEYLGARVKLTGGQHINYILKNKSIKFSSLGATTDLLINLNRIISEEIDDTKPKYWFFIGGGVEHSFETELHQGIIPNDFVGKTSQNSTFGMVNAGIYSQIPLNEFWDMSAEVRGTAVGEAFDGHVYQFKYEGFATLLIGLTYHF